MRHECRRQARTALFWGSTAFVAFQLALAVAIETSWPILRDPDYVQKVTRLHQRLNVPTRPAAVVMFGSSRTVYGLDGTPVERELAGALGRPVVIFNFGLWGAGPATYLVNLQRLLAERARPDLVVLEVLPIFLAEGTGPATDLGRLTADHLSLRDLELLEGCGYPVADRRREWWPAWPLPCYTHRFAVLNAMLPFFLPKPLRVRWSDDSDASCFVPQMAFAYDAARRQAALRKAHEEYADVLQHYCLGGAGTTALRQVLETCRRERIPAALVLMPEGSLFRSWYAPATLRQLDAFLGSLSHEFGAPLIDAREWVADNHFSDSHHLLTGGAAVFSRRLGREVIRPFLQGKPLRRVRLECKERAAVVRERGSFFRINPLPYGRGSSSASLLEQTSGPNSHVP